MNSLGTTLAGSGLGVPTVTSVVVAPSACRTVTIAGYGTTVLTQDPARLHVATPRRGDEDFLGASPATAQGGARAVRFDWHDSTTYGDALHGADRVYLVPPIGDPDPAAVMVPFLEQARATGVRRAQPRKAVAARSGVAGMEFFAEEQTESFARDGFVKPTIGSREQGEAAQALLWEQIGLSPDEPGGWREPVVWAADLTGQGPFGELVRSPALAAGLDAVCGKGGWQPRGAAGNIPIRFPRQPPADDRG